MFVRCLLCRHPREEHRHFSSLTHCSRLLDDGWCRCGAFEHPVWARLLRAWVWLTRLRRRRGQPECRCGTDTALRNVALFARFADPTRLPPWPPARARQILQRIPRTPRFIVLPGGTVRRTPPDKEQR